MAILGDLGVEINRGLQNRAWRDGGLKYHLVGVTQAIVPSVQSTIFIVLFSVHCIKHCVQFPVLDV